VVKIQCPPHGKRATSSRAGAGLYPSVAAWPSHRKFHVSLVLNSEDFYHLDGCTARRRLVEGVSLVIGTTLRHRFLIEKELGRGGMGSVYKATDQVLQRSVAIKVLKELAGEDVNKRIRLEAQILARLLHDNIVRLYDFDDDDGTYYFIMEEVEGTSFFRRWKKIAVPERLQIIAQVADALDYAHHQGVIHRDIKPGNVLLTASDQAKLSDFGLSVLTDAVQESGIVRGTPHYMSPEQAKGKKLDHRTDLYALGVILYECATGGPPFQGSLMTIMAQHVNADPDPPRSRNPEVSEALESLIISLLAKNPDARPSSGREVAARLRDMLDPTRPPATPSLGGLASFAGTASPSVNNGSPVSAASVSMPSLTGAAPGTRMGSMAGPMSAASLSSLASGAPSVGLSLVLQAMSPLARAMLDAVHADPILLNPEERYLSGHYLAYLIGGSRRRGILRRRPLDALNADRARLLLGMTYLSVAGANDDTVAQAARLLDEKPDVRPALGPIVVLKYLAARAHPGKRRKFRLVRQQLQLASKHASAHLLDDQGVLNPGLMPQLLTDLTRIAPERTEVDDQLVQRWNRVTDVWRENDEFRESVLRYATQSAWRDPSSIELWPEVVYPLIERARWQRQLRSIPEQVWDRVCGTLHVPDAGNRLDRAIKVSVPEQVAEKLEIAPDAFLENPDLGPDQSEPAAEREPSGLNSPHGISPASFNDLDVEQPTRAFIRLLTADPVRQSLGELRALFKEAIANLRNPGTGQGHQHVPIGPYRLRVVASIRSKTAGQVAIQGMPNKQIEMLVPSFVGSGPDSKLILAAWVYQNGSLAITYLDNLNNQRYILWDAPTGQQTNFEDAAELNHSLFQLGLEVPDQLDRVLSKRFQPQNPV
jgi:eukaryotic-like serine/threonine-protein kinase